MVRMIESARCEIDLAYYAVDDGDIPLGILALLRQAAQRGVQVHILTDGLQSRLPSDLEAMLAECGVQFRFYHPPCEGRPGWLNRRLHHKLLVVDRRVMIVGSRNLQDHHFGRERVNFIDCDACLAGPIAREAAEHLHELWESDNILPAEQTNSFGLDFVDNLSMGVPPGPLLNERRRKGYNEALREGLRVVRKIERCDSACVSCVVGVDAWMLTDGSSRKRERCLQKQIIALLDSARCSICLETAYPVFSREVFAAIERAAGRGVEISLLTNSLRSTDRASAYAAYQNDKRKLLNLGVALHEIPGPDHLHTKVMVIDRQIAMIGSYNFDVRSDKLNLECCVVTDDARVARLVLNSRQQRLDGAYQIEPRAIVQQIPGDARITKRARHRVTQAVVPLYRWAL